MFRISIKTLLPFAIAMAISGLAWAHSESELRNRIPPHGGLLADAGAYHVELVLKPGWVHVFVADPLDKPINILGATGSANLREKGKQAQQVQLQVVDNRLEGAATVSADVPVTVLIRLKIGGKEQMVPFSWPAGGPKPRPTGG
jgi:hypothetical protein